MRLYLDTSALVKLYVAEDGSTLVREVLAQARLVATASIAYVEARAALARRRHEGSLPPLDHQRTIQAFDADWGRFFRIDMTESLIREAALLAERHRMRAYDAIHLASAATLKTQLGPVTFLSWDIALEAAAHREGFGLLPGRKPKR